MKSREIRQLFISYFTKNGHQAVASSSLVPEDDPTLLFANAGMNQFKSLFLGQSKRSYQRAVTSQKCVRAGGKHNDLENVGFTARHHTFFEMLGNFSFGDYFKKDAIHFAWDLLTRELQIPKDRLYVTVFQDDDEAADIWHKQEGVPKERIYRFGEKDNFWRMGDTGPCGPCSEIFYDHGPEADLDPSRPSKMGGDGDRYVEIWNNVFMQFNESAEGRTSLPKPSVDTGAGLERWAAMLQGQPNNYDTDIFLPILQKAAQVSKKDYVSDRNHLIRDAGLREQVAAMRVIADHSRATAFLIADGVLPSNEGRGYVLRRIMRRAIRYGKKLTDDPSLFSQTVSVVIDEMSAIYPELKRSSEFIKTHVRDEVTRFLTTLDQGTHLLNDALKKIEGRGQKVVDGATLFKLYDTFGFPIDLTRLMASEKGFAVDEPGFESQMTKARERAKSASGSRFKSAMSSSDSHLKTLASKVSQKSGATEFKGYLQENTESKVLALSNLQAEVEELAAGSEGLLVLNQTPFYAESGGQAGDNGNLSGPGVQVQVNDTIQIDHVWFHQIQVLEGRLKVGADLKAQINSLNRKNTAANHSVTHLLHASLRKVLGTHVTQAGSLVEADRLRFDFTHSKPLSHDEIKKIENMVNQEIGNDLEVSCREMAQKEAIQQGALALFGEKYGDQVRVVKMGSFSTELCGGTHVQQTGQIRLFKIVTESGVAAGVRRIEAVSRDAAMSLLLENSDDLSKVRETLGASAQQDGDALVTQIESLKEKIRTLEKEVKRAKSSSVDLSDILRGARPLEKKSKKGAVVSVHAVAAKVDIDDREVLSQLGDQLRDRLENGVVCLIGSAAAGSKLPILITVAKSATEVAHAGQLLGEVAKVLGGKGGGRPDFAQGAGENHAMTDEAIAAFFKNLAP